MPKRRLYQEVAGENNESSPSSTSSIQGRGQQQQDLAGRPHHSHRSSSQRRSSNPSVLLILSDACNKHAAYHQSRKSPIRADADEENLPEKCQKDLQSLRELLPKVEKSFQPPSPGKRGPEASDVAHLCDFYTSILRGNYCPHAPHLLCWGKDPEEVITRAHYLFQHLVTRSVIGSVKNAPSSESNETSFRPVVETVNCTIAHLLSFLADDTTYPFITSDLVNLLVDCSVVIEGGLLPVQLVILPETTRHCRLKKECTLDIQSLEQMFLLQASVFVILRTFLLDLRSKRLGAQSSTFSESTSRDAATVPSGSVDLTLPPDLINNETFSLLLSAIRQVLLFNNCTSILFPFWTHRKLAATLMLKQILQDWQRCHVQSTTMVETSILLVRATKAYLASKTEEPSDYATELAILLRQTFLEPPRVQGTFSLEQTFWIVRSPTISTLLDCLKHISQRPKNRRDVLDAIVLRVLHTMMYPVNDRREDRHLVSMAASYCVSHGLFRTLFSLLSDPKLSNCVVGLLGALLHGVDGSHEMELSCRKTLARLTDDSRARADTDGSSTRTVEVPQRKQPSVPPQKDIRAPIEPLVLSPPKQSPRHTSSSARLRSNQQTENIGLSSMWYEDLQVVLHDTLQASRRLVGSFKSEKMRGTEHENSTLVDDAALTVGGLKLIAHSIHKERRLGKTETDDLSGLFGVAAILSTNLKSCCDVLAQSVATGISDSDFSITQFLVSCGLYLHFAVDSFSEQMVESDNEEKSLQYTLDAFACLGTRLAVTKIPLSTQKIFSCRPSLCHCPNFAKAMTCFMTSFYQNEKPTLDTSCGLKFPLCPCSFFPEILNRGNCKQEKRGLFPFDRVLSVIDCLPFQMRCCLLASLHPPSQDLYYPLPAIPTQTGIYSIDSLFAFVNGNLTSFSDDDDDGRLFATSALSLAQVLLSSLASPSIKIDIGSFLQENGAIGRGKDASSESRSSSLVTLFLKTIMLPLAKTFDPQDEVFSQSLLLSVVRLQAYSTKLYCDGSSFNIRHDATRVFESVFGELGIAPFNGKFTSHDEEVHALLRDVAYSVAGKIQQSHKNPAVRILRWLCLAGVVMVCPSQELRQQFSKVNKGTKEVQTGDRNGAESELRSWMSWLLMTPFSDPDSMVREYTSRKINEVILAENFNLLLSLFSSKEDFQCFSIHMRSTQRTQVDSQCTHELLHASDRIVSDFFREIDRLLHDSCCFVDSQLSLTMAKSHEEVSEKNQAGREDRISIQRSVVRILASICRDADLDLPLHKCLFEKSFIRLIRIWAATPVFNVVEASFPDILSTSSSKALVYGELANLSKCRPLGHLVTKKLSETFIAEAFGDVLILSATKSRDTQFRRLETFIQLLVVGMEETLPRKHTIQECVRFFQESLPAIITQLIVDKDMERLRLTAGFREFLDDRNKDAKAAQDNNPDVVGGSNAQRRHRFPSLTSSDQDLAKKIRNLCLEPKLIEKILPLILINTDRLGMVFFTRDVLKGSGLDLHEIITNREQLIIKNLVWELGRDPDREGLVVRAIRTAAVSRLNQSGARQENRVASPETTEISATTQWVTSHFMYLLVNVIQFKWKTRTAGERLHSLRCLHIILDFLQPAESAQYFPQIMATVNMAITNDEDSGDEEKNSYDSGCSRLYAVKALSKFVRLVALHQLETITLNLTTIVVSLIPVLEDGKVVREFPEHWAIQESREAAVSLLEYLTTGNIGRSLAESFKEIPFLPSSPALENVNRALRSNGVDFDNLLVLSNGTQHRRESFTIEESLTLTSRASSSASKNASGKLVALQKRLAMICTLLDNEITSVRRVALQHLIDILRANRDLFHALIANEGTASMKLYLTAIFRESNTAQQSSADCGWLARGAVTEMMEKLLTRCVHEADSHTRILLATCLGEVGAIGEHRLGDLKIGNSIGDDSLDSASGSYRWQLDQPPWQSQAAKYELQLLTKHLAAAIKAAPSSTDQHKVAFTIQQLLRLLDKSARQSEVGTVTGSDPNGREISKWLKDKLNEAGVYEVIEPFWSSEFKEKNERYVSRKPPFFKVSPNYYAWISNFCRWMILSAHDCALSRWKDFFFACRTVVRTQAGLNVSEFILPLLILDRICFGSHTDQDLIRQEFLQVFSFESSSPMSMGQSDRQKAVSALFAVIDTLSYWSERETENRQRSSRSASSSTSRRRVSSKANDDLTSLTSWPADETITQIEELLSMIPLPVQASAADNVGMHARALRLLEMAARKSVVEHVFESSVDQQSKDVDCISGQTGFASIGNLSLAGIDVDLIKDVLARLDDCETMVGIGGGSFLATPLLQVKDSIRQKEAAGNFQAALQDYERALQVASIGDRDSDLQRGVLQCLLELGQFESVLNQVAGLIQKDADLASTKSFAVEAAWRLGRWQTLAGLIENEVDKDMPGANFDCYDTYQLSTGKAMLGIQRRETSKVLSAIRSGREVLLQNLSIFARESYARSYPEIVRLQCLRELENATEILCQDSNACNFTLDEIAHSTLTDGWAWDGRLDLATSRGASSVISTRVALARLSGDSVLEGSLFLNIGKRARKNGLFSIAENFFSQAEAAFSSIPPNKLYTNPKLGMLMDATRVQVAKLKHETGESTIALKMLGQEGVHRAFEQMLPQIQNAPKIQEIAVNYERQRITEVQGLSTSVTENKQTLTNRFASRILRLTQWTVEGGLKGGSEITGRFEIIHKLAPKWEKGHFHYGKYIDSVMQSRLTILASRSSFGVGEDLVRANIIVRDKTSQKYILLAMKHYATALNLDTKYVYQALPRLLSLWFDFVSIRPDHISFEDLEQSSKKSCADILSNHQNDANTCLANNMKSISAAAFYTAMPQLIARVVHDDKDTAMVVQGILIRVLTKFPQQAMWPLAWLKGSRNPDRSKIGEEIFNGAQKNLSRKNKAMQKLLAGSGSLFRYLREIATYSAPAKNGYFSVKPWQGTIELSEFIPPVQAALSISPLSSSQSGSKDYFPPSTPRMRTFSSRVGVMSSKAKPKRIRAFAVPGSFKHGKSTNVAPKGASSANPQPGDIGEISFLVKQEAKGDLRKDARVQDLNNVINRLMASSSDSGASLRRRRRLHLRTFAVTCLSEDIGVLEWVPDTNSLRNLIGQSYNPQTSPFCTRRRGTRLANFGDPTLRSNFERCQHKYFKEGNLSMATAMFEQTCLRPYPPLLYWWFVQKFHDPHAWYEARNRFTLSAAAWSAVGHVIGLGDRHSENILVDTSSGDCVHVDFDCIFDKGLNLPRPEVVPFRLTPNMLDAFGPTGAEGIYTSGLQFAMGTLRDNRDTLLSVLEPFLKDPVIDWKRHRSQQNTESAQERQTKDAKRSINVIDERLKGIYNLRNPNLRKYPRTDGLGADQDDELTNLLPLSVEGQVHKMIAEATSHENLLQLYVGWMPWM